MSFNPEVKQWKIGDFWCIYRYLIPGWTGWIFECFFQFFSGSRSWIGAPIKLTSQYCPLLQSGVLVEKGNHKMKLQMRIQYRIVDLLRLLSYIYIMPSLVCFIKYDESWEHGILWSMVVWSTTQWQWFTVMLECRDSRQVNIRVDLDLDVCIA